jgi:hypothetical protein
MSGRSGFGGSEYTIAKVRGMFSSWIEDAKVGMLFLKNIRTIELSDGTAPMTSVTKHDRSKSLAVQYLAKQPLSSSTSQVSIVDIKSTLDGVGNNINAAPLSWLVYTEDALPENAPQNIRSHVQNRHWSTQSGVAIPLGDDRLIKSFRGRLMVHLPTPIETKLPFHLHAGFALTTNRKTLAGGSNIDDQMTMWNTYLLGSCLPLTAIRAYEQLLRWSFRPAYVGGPQRQELSEVIPLYFKRWPLKASDIFVPFLRGFFQHTYTTPVFPCRGHLSELPIVAVAGENAVMKGEIVLGVIESQVFAWLREGGRSVAETPFDVRQCLKREWGHEASFSFKQIDCNLLRKRLREDPSFLSHKLTSTLEKQSFLEEIFRPIVEMETRVPVEEPLDGLCVVPLVSGEWKPLCSSSVYYVATDEARELIEGKEVLVDTDVFGSDDRKKVMRALFGNPSYGIKELQLSAFASIFLSENPNGVSEDKRERVWKYLEGFNDLTAAHELAIVKTTAGEVVTLAKATGGLEISTAGLQDRTMRTMTEFFRRLGVVVFQASENWDSLYLRRLRVDYTELRVLELIAKHWSTFATTFVITSDEADFVRTTIGHVGSKCRDSVLRSLGDLPIWSTYGSPRSPLLSAKEALFMTDHDSLDHLGHHPSILRQVTGMLLFERMGASPIEAAKILRDRIMPKFATRELDCVGDTRLAYLSLCRSVVNAASSSSMRNNTLARQTLTHASCFLSRDGSFQILAHMFVPREELTETIFVNEQHRFPDSDLYNILDRRGGFKHGIRGVASAEVVEECARLVLSEVSGNLSNIDQSLSRATHLVRYIYAHPETADWMDPKWMFVPREMNPEYPYNQCAPAYPRYMSFATLCYPAAREYLWTQRAFFPQDLVPSAMFKDKYPKIGKQTWQECCQHLEVLVRDIAPTMTTTERQLTFKAMIFKIYKMFDDRSSKDPTASESIKNSLREIKTVRYILNGDDKDPSKAESWVWPHDLVFGIDHKIGAHQQAHPSLLKFQNFLVTVGANEMKHIAGQVNVAPRRKTGEMEDRITTYFETQDDKNGFMDVKFVFESGKSILAHKVVLASRSDEIIRQLTGLWSMTARRDPADPAIDIIQKEDDYATFWGLLYFLYTDDLIGTNGPPTFLAASKTLKEQDAEDQLSQRVEYLVDLQRLADFYRADRLKGLIAQELMLPGKVMYSNVFDIREHAELNRDPSVVKYCNQFIRVKENASLIEKYLEDEVVSVQAKLVALDRYLCGEGTAKAAGLEGEGDDDDDEPSAKEALTTELDDLRAHLRELKIR